MEKKLFNSSHLEDWKEVDQENWRTLVCDILQLFLDSTPERFDGLMLAWRFQQWHIVREAAHALKSSCGNVGAQWAHELLNEIEKHCQNGDTHQATLALEELQVVFEATLGAISNYANDDQAA